MIERAIGGNVVFFAQGFELKGGGAEGSARKKEQ
jgi:hypothetical protein